jgi:UDP-3-O-[3-hydroxymyristoyl] glucosamine N-acyltransferase
MMSGAGVSAPPLNVDSWKKGRGRLRFTIRQLAELVRGQVFGDGELTVHAARPLDTAGPGEISFVESASYQHLLSTTRASAVVVPKELTVTDRTVIRVADPLTAFVEIARLLHGRPEALTAGVHERAHVHPSARLGEGVSVGPFACVGEGCEIGPRCCLHAHVVVGRDCKIGADSEIFAGVVLYDGTVLGQRVTVHANSVLGADGFGYRFQEGRHVKVPQLGHVELGDDVEIGSCTTIDRGTFQATRVGAGSKIDNLVQVGHNCQIGRHNLFVSQMGIAGSSSTGDYVVIAGQAGVVDHVHIGQGAVIGAQSGVNKDVPAGLRVLGAPARPEREQKRILILLEKLSAMRRDLQRIKQQLGLGDEEAAA